MIYFSVFATRFFLVFLLTIGIFSTVPSFSAQQQNSFDFTADILEQLVPGSMLNRYSDGGTTTPQPQWCCYPGVNSYVCCGYICTNDEGDEDPNCTYRCMRSCD